MHTLLGQKLVEGASEGDEAWLAAAATVHSVQNQVVGIVCESGNNTSPMPPGRKCQMCSANNRTHK